jgi:hypothetical protein
MCLALISYSHSWHSYYCINNCSNTLLLIMRAAHKSECSSAGSFPAKVHNWSNSKAGAKLDGAQLAKKVDPNSPRIITASILHHERETIDRSIPSVPSRHKHQVGDLLCLQWHPPAPCPCMLQPKTHIIWMLRQWMLRQCLQRCYLLKISKDDVCTLCGAA